MFHLMENWSGGSDHFPARGFSNSMMLEIFEVFGVVGGFDTSKQCQQRILVQETESQPVNHDNFTEVFKDFLLFK